MFAASKTAAAAAGAPPASTDPQFNYVSLLLNDTGTNGQQNNTFLDSSSNNFTITRNGTPTQGSVTPYWPDGQWSNYFSGSTQYLSFPGTVNQNLIGNGNFTIECWAYSTGTSFNQTLMTHTDLSSGRGYGWNLRFESNYNIKFYVGSGTAGSDNEFLTATSTGITSNTWNHIAIVRNGAMVYVYVNGVQKGSAAMPAVYDLTGRVSAQIAQRGTSLPEPFPGYISNARIVNGTALYTSNFTPSTTPLTAVSGTSLLTCQSNRFKDNSSNNFAITVTGTPTVQAFDPFSPASSYGVSNGGSGFFNGTTDYLTTSGGQTFSGDFTIEGWVYLTNLPTFSMLLGETDFPSYVGIKPTAIEVGFARSSNYPNWNFTFVRNTWYHIAISRQSGTVRCFLNGQQLTLSSGSATDTSTLSDGALAIGRYSYSPFYYFPGYISNLRIVNGTAVYTAAFTPPTSPVTAITGTSLLLNCTNAGIYDAATLNDLVTVGDAKVSTAQAKFGSSSMAFDGTGDWLTFVDSPANQFGTGNFTIEGWVYLSTTGTAKYIAAKGTSTTGWALGVNSSNQIVFNYTSSTLTGSTALSSGQWYHIAVVRNGTATGNVKIYLSGTSDATSGGAINDNFNQTSIGYVGADRTGTNAMNGYLDDLRITKGYARYTANFTPPTAPFPTR
jgi:hypothetical protein